MIASMLQIAENVCPTSAPFFGFMGVSAALVFASESPGLPATRKARRASPTPPHARCTSDASSRPARRPSACEPLC
jgi:hypothetical protein